MQEKLRAGIAVSKITPSPGISMSGYATRPGPAAGVHDDLYCKCIVFSNGQTKAALVTLDILGLTFEQFDFIRKSAAKAFDIPASQIMIVTSHTHAGPAIQMLRFCGTPDDAYLAGMFDTIVKTIGEAASDIRPCDISTGGCESELAINRRNKARDGSIQLSDNADGFRDTRVKIIRITRDNKPGAVLYNYACHGVVLGSDNVQISADWIGAASRFIESKTGDHAFFIQGCCGNINPSIRGGFDAVEAAGRLVGEPVVQAIGDMEKSTRTGSNLRTEIAAASTIIQLPLLPLPEKEELLSIGSQMRQQIESERDAGKPEHMLDWPKGLEEWSRAALERVESGMVETAIAVELSVLRIDSFRIFAIPGEVFAEYGDAIKSSAPHVIVAGYANGNIGYVPTEEAFKSGGYEVDSAYKLYGIQMIGPESEGLILSAAKELLKIV